MDSTAIIGVLSGQLPGDIAGLEAVPSLDGMPTIVIPRDRLVEACRILRDAPDLQFGFLADITVVDYLPREPRFEVLYIMASLGVGGYGDTAKRLRVKVRVPGADPRLPTVSGIWTAANWAEREAFDLFGVLFDDHPDLRRILMPDDWEGYPMRRDYPVQIKQPVKTYEPLQVSEEEFVANVEAARSRSGKA